MNSTSLGLREGIFLLKGCATGSAAKIFCGKLQIIVKECEEEISEYIQVSRCNAHGVRKSSATYSVSCSTAPPSSCFNCALRRIKYG